MSYIERTARKLYPILNELKKRMIPDKENQKNIFNSITGLIDSVDNEIKPINPGVTKNQEVDLQSILGYLN